MLKRSLWWVTATALAMLLPLSASAEMSDSDRQARCENNQARLAPLNMQYASFASDEEIARLRTANASISRFFSNKYDHRSADGRRRSSDELWERVRHLSRSNCNDGPYTCLTSLQIEIERRIDDAVRQIPQRDAVARDIANTQARMAELQCNAPEPPSGESATGWHAAGSGDCPGQDEDSSSGLLPDPGMCTAGRAGKVAVCWDGSNRFHNHYGETHGHSTYPWCTYKSTGSCGGGENTGRLYICHP